MNFRSINKFNVAVNALSGNFLPLSEEPPVARSSRTIYVGFTWLLKFFYLTSTSVGLARYVPAFQALQLGAVSAIGCVEMLALSAYLNSRRETLRALIRRINRVLVDSDDLRRCIRDTVEPHKRRLKIYTVATVGSVFVWAATPVVRILDTDRFTYTDFALPTYVPVAAPFNVGVFVCGVVVEALGGTCIMFKKTALDVYVNYLITLLTAKYRYVREQLAVALRWKSVDQPERNMVIESLRKCVRDQSEVVEIGQMLKELLAVTVGLTYLSCVLRFCFLGFFIITIPGAYLERCLYASYAIGTLIQVYMFCSCSQELLEASTSITDDAFHEDWHGRGNSVKRIFRTVGLSNRMECRLSAFRIVDLTVPTFVAILNQAYSACLLLLRIK